MLSLHSRRARIELLALLALLPVTLFLRLWFLHQFPPGFHFDEAIDLKIGLDVAGGARPIYVAEGWGREGLYYYLVALLLQLVPYNPMALRAAAVLCGLGLLLTAYLLARDWHSPAAAWFTTAWLSVTFWPLAASRFGVRHESLAFMMGLAALAFWRVWKSDNPSPWRYGLAGFLLGLTMYTYQPARFMPLVFLAFALYLLLFQRQQLYSSWRHWLVYGAVFLLTVAPLVVALSSNHALEVEQRAFTIAPLTELLGGNPRPILENALETLKAFTISGDPLKSYNIPGRPIFVPSWTGLFFYAGLALALWRWREPKYAFVLLWLFFSLLPTVVTISAPNFNRMVAAQMPVMFLAALPMAAVAQWTFRNRARWRALAMTLILVLVLVPVTVATFRDYFHRWPQEYADVHTLNREVAAVAYYLEHSSDSRPAIISSRNIEDEDPYIVSVSIDREDFSISWSDTAQTLAMPAGVDQARLIIADRWLDGELAAWAGVDSQPIYSHPQFTVLRLDDGEWTTADSTELGYVARDAFPLSQDNVHPLPWNYPYQFCACSDNDAASGQLMLTGLSPAPALSDDGSLQLITSWQTQGDAGLVSLAIFVHLLDSEGQIMAQFDGLGYPPHTWDPGDRFVQLSRLAPATPLPPGQYWLQLGLYERESGRRWLLLNPEGEVIGDRLVLGPLQLQEDGVLLRP